MDNVLDLHLDLKNKTYHHDGYHAFSISDPKPRNIHKATVRDRLLHHAAHRILYPYFDKKFIHDSYSCRLNKGTHKSMNQFHKYFRKISRNNTRTCWVLKCDIKKFFASIDHTILLEILKKHILDLDILWLLERIITSFESFSGKGLPLGSLTSQLLANVYMNEFDHYMKHELKIQYYIRYADDFLVLSSDKNILSQNVRYIVHFLQQKLKLSLHPDKVFIKTIASGADFLGWVHFPHHRVLRTTTKKRMFRKLSTNFFHESLISYLGLLKHGNTHKLRHILDDAYIHN